MPLTPLAPGSIHVAYDDDKHQLMLYTGNLENNEYTIIGYAPCHIMQGGNIAEVSADGALKAADWGGHPIAGHDPAGTDTYVTIVTAPRRCRYLTAHCLTQSAMISIDGGSTDSLSVAVTGQIVFAGLDIPAGTKIQARNAKAGSNYASLYVCVW